MNLTSLNVPLRAPETEFMPRYNQLDLSFSKVFNVRGFRILPKVDIFNALNSDRWSTVTTPSSVRAPTCSPRPSCRAG